jgi:hypothetical protein
VPRSVHVVMKPKPDSRACRTTVFLAGDQFIATSSVQGMVAGKHYIVVALDERKTVFFGNFVAYLVSEVGDCTPPFWVKNLHLLATRVDGP